MRILITGSRAHPRPSLVRDALLEATAGMDPADVTIVSGNCPTGADNFAETIARQQGFNLELHPANWKELGRRAGPVRNQKMVDLGADLVLAFPTGDSHGTRHCISAALQAGLNVSVKELA